jgi:hypothetical protein
MPEGLGGIEAGETGTEDHDVGTRVGVSHAIRESFSEVHGLASPPGEADDFLDRGHRSLVPVGGIHPPAHVLRIGERKKREVAPPTSPAKRPKQATEI